MSDRSDIRSGVISGIAATRAAISSVDADDRPLTIIRPPSALGVGLVGHLRRLPQYADLLYVLTVHRVKVRYKQSMLGMFWAVLQPLLLMLIFTVLFALTESRMQTGGLPYSVFVYSAVLPWTFFSTAVLNGTTSLVSHGHLVTKVSFPREILPLSYVTAALFDLLVASTLLVGLMLYHGVAPTGHAVMAVPIVALITVFAVGVSLALSAVQVGFRDVGLAMPLLLQVWMFLTPVVYPYSEVPARFRWLYQLNPMAGPIESFRRVTVQGQAPDWHLLAVSAVLSLALLPAAFACFKYMDATIADRV